jgi:hypothetical protein
MQRYTVNICDDTGGRSCILVPFQPFALVDAFKDEIVKRAARQNPPITITAENHMLILRLQSLSGPILDVEDVLADVVLTSETIFAVFSQRAGHVTAHPPQVTSAAKSATVSEESAIKPIEGEAIRDRAVTPATAEQVRSSLETFATSTDTTIQQRHEQVARQESLSGVRPVSNMSEEPDWNNMQGPGCPGWEDRQTHPETPEGSYYEIKLAPGYSPYTTEPYKYMRSAKGGISYSEMENGCTFEELCGYLSVPGVDPRKPIVVMMAHATAKDESDLRSFGVDL